MRHHAARIQRTNPATRLLSGLLLVALAGCVNSAPREQILQPMLSHLALQKPRVRLRVQGVQRMAPDGDLQALDPVLTERLGLAVTNGASSWEMVSAGEADYELVIFMRYVERRQAAFRTTVMVFTSWRLTALPARRVLWEAFFPTAYPAVYELLPHGWVRRKIAVESAFTDNITHGITALSRLH